jgi:hypothetical protein
MELSPSWEAASCAATHPYVPPLYSASIACRTLRPVSHIPVLTGRFDFTFTLPGWCRTFNQSFLVSLRDRRRIIAMCLLYRRYQKYKKNLIHWVHPINEKGKKLVCLHTISKSENRWKKGFNHFRMSISSFNDLHERLKDNLQRQNNKMRNCIQPVQMLAIALS